MHFGRDLSVQAKLQIIWNMPVPTEESFEGAVIGDIVEDRPSVILPGYDERIQIY